MFLILLPDQYKTQEMCDKVVSKEPFMLKCCLDRYETQELCDKAVDAYLPPLKFVPDWFVTNKMLGKHENVVFSNDDIDLDDIDSDVVTYFSDDIGFNTIDLNNINLDDDNFDEDDPEIIIHVRLMAWCNTYKQHKACKKELRKELMLVAWNLARWWNWCIPEDEKKEIEPLLLIKSGIRW